MIVLESNQLPWFTRLFGKHSGANLGKALNNCLKKWQGQQVVHYMLILDAVFSLVW